MALFDRNRWHHHSEIASCQKDEIAPPISDIELQNQERVVLHFDNLPENIQQYFDEDFSIRIPGKKQNSPFGKINKNIKAKKVRLKNGITTYTFALLTNSDDIVKSQEGYYFYNLVIKENEYEDELYVIRYEPIQEWLNTGHDFGNFQGIITLFSLDGEKLNSIDTINLGSSGETNKEVCPAYLVSVTYSCSGMESSSTQSCYWIYTYEVSCPAGGTTGTSTGGGDTGDGIPDPASIPTEPTEDWDYGAGGGTDTTTEEVKVFNELEGKAECVFNKLNQTSTTFVEAIKKFDGEFPVSHLKFSMANLADTKMAITIPPEDYVIEIQLNNDQSSSGVDARPNLLTAKTIIHEAIHAEMWRKILSIIDNGGNVAGLTRQEWTNKLSNGDFPGIFYYYSVYGINEFQHPQMATHYRDAIADALQEYDNYSHSRDFYMDIAWEGLRYSNIPAWSNLSTSEKERINDVISNYISNNSNEDCIN